MVFTEQNAREMSTYVWDNMPLSMNYCRSIHRMLQEEKNTPLYVLSPSLCGHIRDLMVEYCDKNNFSFFEDAISAGYNEVDMLNRMFDAENNP